MLSEDGGANTQLEGEKRKENPQDMNGVATQGDHSSEHGGQRSNSNIDSIYTSRELPYSSPTSESRKDASSAMNLPVHSAGHQVTNTVRPSFSFDSNLCYLIRASVHIERKYTCN